MKRITLIAALIVLTLGASKPAAAQNRYIVRSTGGLSSVLNLCNLLKCQVQGGLDGQVGQTFLVTSSNNLLVNLLNGTLNLVQSLLGIVAVIDTGVDVNHPVLSAVLLPGYDFTRKQAGASEWLDVLGLENGPTNTGAPNLQPGYVQQSTAAVLDQSTAAVLDGDPYSAFGHGTMTSGLIHLVAPKAKILPLKAFSSNGTGQLSDIVAALYYAVQHHANVVNMSFDLTSSSPALTQAA